MLELIISKGLHISGVVVTDVHYCDIFKMTISADTSRIKAEVMTKHCINENS